MSHRSAAELWWQSAEVLQPATHGRARIPPASGPVDISVPRDRPRRRVAVRVHRVRIRQDEITRLRVIAITTPARTLLDLAAGLEQRELEQVFARMLRARLASPSDLNRLLERYPAKSGGPRLRALLDAGPPALTRSEAEERFLTLVQRARLPRPRTNVKVAGYEVDLVWPAQRLVVEVDGYAFHSSRDAFEADRRRDAAFAAAGFRVMRVTWRHLTNEPETVVARLAQALVSLR